VTAVAASGGASPDAPAPAAPAGVPVDAAALAAGGPIVAADVPYGPLVAVTARRYGISASLLTALVWQESGFNARARSRSGARGLTQLMPATARELGVRRSYDPVQNVDGGARYLRAQLLRFGSAALALAAYNAGPQAVVRHRGIPPYRETRQYVRNVLTIEARLRAAGVR
jgi:soluble lytic murein transglycosylase-like protein